MNGDIRTPGPQFDDNRTRHQKNIDRLQAAQRLTAAYGASVQTALFLIDAYQGDADKAAKIMRGEIVPPPAPCPCEGQEVARDKAEHELLALYRRLRRSGKVGMIVVSWNGHTTEVRPTFPPEVIAA